MCSTEHANRDGLSSSFTSSETDGLGNYVIGVDSVAAIILRVFEHGLRSAADESAVELAHRPWASAVWAYDARA